MLRVQHGRTDYVIGPEQMCPYVAYLKHNDLPAKHVRWVKANGRIKGEREQYYLRISLHYESDHSRLEVYSADQMFATFPEATFVPDEKMVSLDFFPDGVSELVTRPGLEDAV